MFEVFPTGISLAWHVSALELVVRGSVLNSLILEQEAIFVMRDLIVEQILNDDESTMRFFDRQSYIPERFPHRNTRLDEQPSGWRMKRNARPGIPPASRYPHSAARADLERSLQPWNRGMLGTNDGNRARI